MSKMSAAGLALLIMFVAAVPVPSGQTADRAAGLERALRTVKSLQAEFDQYYYSVTVSTPLHEKGRFYFQKPDLMRWEYVDPDPKVFLYKDEVFSQYYPGDNQLIRSGLSKAQYESEILTLLSGQKRLTDDYLVEMDASTPAARTAGRLKLTPRVEGQYAWITLDPDPRTGLIARAVFRDWAENRTEFVFSKIKENAALKPSVFTLTVPPDCEIVDDTPPLFRKKGSLPSCVGQPDLTLLAEKACFDWAMIKVADTPQGSHSGEGPHRFAEGGNRRDWFPRGPGANPAPIKPQTFKWRQKDAG
jgi:outer membrane lipoprotein carrier protein